VSPALGLTLQGQKGKQGAPVEMLQPCGKGHFVSTIRLRATRFYCGKTDGFAVRPYPFRKWAGLRAELKPTAAHVLLADKQPK